jgi:hypothetical protein
MALISDSSTIGTLLSGPSSKESLLEKMTQLDQAQPNGNGNLLNGDDAHAEKLLSDLETPPARSSVSAPLESKIEDKAVLKALDGVSPFSLSSTKRVHFSDEVEDIIARIAGEAKARTVEARLNRSKTLYEAAIDTRTSLIRQRNDGEMERRIYASRRDQCLGTLDSIESLLSVVIDALAEHDFIQAVLVPLKSTLEMQTAALKNNCSALNRIERSLGVEEHDLLNTDSRLRKLEARILDVIDSGALPDTNNEFDDGLDDPADDGSHDTLSASSASGNSHDLVNQYYDAVGDIKLAFEALHNLQTDYDKSRQVRKSQREMGVELKPPNAVFYREYFNERARQMKRLCDARNRAWNLKTLCEQDDQIIEQSQYLNPSWTHQFDALIRPHHRETKGNRNVSKFPGTTVSEYQVDASTRVIIWLDEIQKAQREEDGVEVEVWPYLNQAERKAAVASRPQIDNLSISTESLQPGALSTTGKAASARSSQSTTSQEEMEDQLHLQSSKGIKHESYKLTSKGNSPQPFTPSSSPSIPEDADIESKHIDYLARDNIRTRVGHKNHTSQGSVDYKASREEFGIQENFSKNPQTPDLSAASAPIFEDETIGKGHMTHLSNSVESLSASRSNFNPTAHAISNGIDIGTGGYPTPPPTLREQPNELDRRSIQHSKAIVQPSKANRQPSKDVHQGPAAYPAPIFAMQREPSLNSSSDGDFSDSIGYNPSLRNLEERLELDSKYQPPPMLNTNAAIPTRTRPPLPVRQEELDLHQDDALIPTHPPPKSLPPILQHTANAVHGNVNDIIPAPNPPPPPPPAELLETPRSLPEVLLGDGDNAPPPPPPPPPNPDAIPGAAEGLPGTAHGDFNEIPTHPPPTHPPPTHPPPTHPPPTHPPPTHPPPTHPPPTHPPPTVFLDEVRRLPDTDQHDLNEVPSYPQPLVLPDSIKHSVDSETHDDIDSGASLPPSSTLQQQGIPEQNSVIQKQPDAPGDAAEAFAYSVPLPTSRVATFSGAKRVVFVRKRASNSDSELHPSFLGVRKLNPFPQQLPPAPPAVEYEPDRTPFSKNEMVSLAQHPAPPPPEVGAFASHPPPPPPLQADIVMTPPPGPNTRPKLRQPFAPESVTSWDSGSTDSDDWEKAAKTNALRYGINDSNDRTLVRQQSNVSLNWEFEMEKYAIKQEGRTRSNSMPPVEERNFNLSEYLRQSRSLPRYPQFMGLED